MRQSLSFEGFDPMRTFVVTVVLASAAIGGLVAQTRPAPKPYTTWSQYAGGSHSSQFTALDQINKNTVSKLEVAWTYPVGERAVSFNPIVVDGVMYVQAKGSSIVALDPVSGKELWERPNQGAIGARGINYWQSADGSDRRLIYLNGGMITQINAKTDEPITSFGENGKVDLRKALVHPEAVARPLQTSNPGRVYQNLFIISLPASGAAYESNPADVQAYDILTGKLAWVFHSIPRPGEFGAETWPAGFTENAGGGHNWSEFTVDDENGIVFVPFGTARYDFFGGNRAGNNLFANSLVALDAKTGRRLWHFQTIHHDVWDYDLPQSPKLLTIRQNGQPVQVVAQGSKQGFLYVFERKTGRPVYPIEEKPVPQSDLPGEHSSPTQPIPTKVKPFARQSFTEKDVNPFLPKDEQDAIKEKLRGYRNEGIYTPPSVKGTVQVPGHNGGANWGSSAVDPLKGEYYIVTKESPTVLKAFTGAPNGAMGGAVQGAAPAPAVPPADYTGLYRVPIDFWLTSMNLSAMGPPWSQLTAYDLNTGEIKWQVPNGTVAGLPEIPEWKGPTGAHWPRGGPLVTGGGLVFVATGSDRKFRAYDRDNGKVVWTTDIPSSSDGVPASYEVNGRQFIVIPVSGLGSNPVRVNGKTVMTQGLNGYIAFALPDKK
jgi:quinate dehydrogenase (quinone)